jgi:hypothetical protein
MLRRILILTIAVVIVLAIGQEAEADWLGGWDNRIKLTIDHNDITSNLSNFPILIHLSNSSGRKNDDVSCVFDELTSNANRKKIAVTKSDGATQCYVEIEKWDDANEQAWLWVKVSGTGSISRSADTDLYLYYDKDQTDNTTYVDDTNIGNSYKVWDDGGTNYFKGVWHLKENAAGTGTADLYKDSTSNNNDGDDYVSAGKSSKVNGAQQFDGSNDYIDLPDTSFPSGNSPRTVSFWIYDVASTENHYIFFYGKTGVQDVPSTYNKRFAICIENRRWQKLCVVGYGNDWNTGYTLPTGVWKHVAFTFNGSTIRLYIDGSWWASTAETYNTVLINQTFIGCHEGYGAGRVAFHQGRLDEMRLSNTARSAAWIKASYEGERDDLLDFGSEEEAPKNAIFFGINF